MTAVVPVDAEEEIEVLVDPEVSAEGVAAEVVEEVPVTEVVEVEVTVEG